MIMIRNIMTEPKILFPESNPAIAKHNAKALVGVKILSFNITHEKKPTAKG